MKPLTALLAVAALSPGWALAQSQPGPQDTPPAAARAVPQESTTDKGEPNVKYTVIEDDSVRIDETKVRGNTQKISVTPKIGPKKGYEIITSDGSRDLGFGANTSRGAAGARVWSVFKF